MSVEIIGKSMYGRFLMHHFDASVGVLKSKGGLSGSVVIYKSEESAPVLHCEESVHRKAKVALKANAQISTKERPWLWPPACESSVRRMLNQTKVSTTSDIARASADNVLRGSAF